MIASGCERSGECACTLAPMHPPRRAHSLAVAVTGSIQRVGTKSSCLPLVPALVPLLLLGCAVVLWLAVRVEERQAGQHSLGAWAAWVWRFGRQGEARQRAAASSRQATGGRWRGMGGRSNGADNEVPREPMDQRSNRHTRAYTHQAASGSALRPRSSDCHRAHAHPRATSRSEPLQQLTHHRHSLPSTGDQLAPPVQPSLPPACHPPACLPACPGSEPPLIAT